MATLDELQQQLAALSARVDALTTPPDDYYTSKYSGEEIDAGIEKTGSLPESWPLPIASGGTGADTAQLALANLGGRPNRKLLRNGYFIGGGSQKGNGCLPINQKAQLTYEYTTKNISIDGWAFWGVPATMQLTDDGLIVGKKSDGGNGYVIWEQIVDENIPEGSQLTASALLDNNELITLTLDPGWTYAGDATLKSVSYRNEALWIRTTSDNHIAVRFYWGGAIALGRTSLYKVVGLEYGDKQTIAYKDANGNWKPTEVALFGEELSRCQRCLYIPALSTFSTFYYASVNSASGDIFFPVILPVPMRATPAVTVINATLYVGTEQKTVTASAITCYALRGNQALCRANGVAVGASARTGIVEIGGLQLSAEL